MVQDGDDLVQTTGRAIYRDFRSPTYFSSFLT